ncbi:MAG: Beta-glucosidase A [Myxococcota bacterium]|nr:Beta-glucosidase A [Myxococcota bacterium]
MRRLNIPLWLLVAVLAACSDSNSNQDAGGGNDSGGPADGAAGDASPATGTGALQFPKSFLWGTAIAGFQVDMGCPTLPAEKCVDKNSDWYVFTTAPEQRANSNAHLANQDPAETGPGFWELYDQDIERAKSELKNNALRFSIEWSRIFPTATDGVEGFDNLKAIASKDAIETYHKILKSLKDRGMQPLVTLNHYTLPLWLHDPVDCLKDLSKCKNKGWVDRERAVREIAKYAGFCAKEFGGEIDMWATLNEPFQVFLFGYLQPNAERAHPPAVMLKFEESKTIAKALIDAHARMYDAIKANDSVDADGDGEASFVGVVYPITPTMPADANSRLDKRGSDNVFYLWNRFFLNAVALGEYDDKLDGNAVQRADLKNRMDYIGVNYYFQLVVTGTKDATLPALSPLTTFNPLQIKYNPVYPKGIKEMIEFVRNEYKLPVIITENGAAITNDTEDEGPKYLVQHLTWVNRAIQEGADVRGYFYWTLMDNYEWNHGMNIRMGMYAVDKDDKSKKRTPRRNVAVYGSIAGTGGISKELQGKFPAE